MPAMRCSICALDWPQHKDYKECPECGEPTTRFSNIEAMEMEEARSRKAHADFERFYEEYDASAGPLETRGASA